MAGNLAPVLKHQFFDSNGNPLSGGKLYAYQSGTTTPQATYTDSGLGTPNTNPVILDSSGRASIWLDPTLSYKFILQDSTGAQIWSVDNIIGLLTANAVNTAALQDLSVTQPKIALRAVGASQLQDDASIDANRAVTTNHMRDGVVTRPKLNTSFGLLAPTLQSFLTGSGTYNKTYLFQVSGANATAAAVYTNNSVSFTVVGTIAGGTLLQCTASGAPTSSGTLTRVSGSGDATIAFTAFAAPLYIKVKMVGGGAGGYGGGAGGTTGTAGGNTTFGTTLLVANGGAAGASQSAGGLGGTASLGTGPFGVAFQGGAGGSGTGGAIGAGGLGATTPFGGAGYAGNPNSGGSGAAAITNTGSGGGGGMTAAGTNSGGGGGAGGFVDAIITSPAVTYAYAVGAAGTGGTAGTSGGGGGAGASGSIYVEEHYQ